MFKLNLADPQEPSSLPQQQSYISKSRRFGKKLYALGAIVIVIIIVTAFLFSSRTAEAIPLSLNYEVGEKMVYVTSAAMTTQRYNATNDKTATETMNTNSSLILDIVGFDGETYTLNNTITVDIQGRIVTVPIATKVNQTNYASNFLFSEALTLIYNMASDTYDYEKLTLPQAKVGDSLQIQVKTGNESIGMTGTLTLKFASIENITVPAGTYKVFRIDYYTTDLTTRANLQSSLVTINIPEPIPSNITGQTYLEYGTWRLIKFICQQTAYVQTQNFTYRHTSERILTQHTKP